MPLKISPREKMLRRIAGIVKDQMHNEVGINSAEDRADIQDSYEDVREFLEQEIVKDRYERQTFGKTHIVKPIKTLW